MAQHVVIIGGGFGGLEAAFSLRSILRPSAGISLIDRNEYHSHTPSIHEIVSGKVRSRDIQIPLSVVPGAGFIQRLRMKLPI